jgi:very-short-patch-repair endonuclease
MSRRVIERNMFYGAKKNIFLRAFELRNNMTVAEKVLWKELRNKSRFKERFKCQHPIGIFVVDFYCHRLSLVIEVDGGIHEDERVAEYDDGRSHDIEKFGFTILRFKNEEILENIESVITRIQKVIESRSQI